MSLPHCTGCTEPGAVTHQQETVEHIHDACGATIAALRDAIAAFVVLPGAMPTASASREAFIAFSHLCDAYQRVLPAAAKLLAERDAGRALFEAVRNCDGANDPQATDALEAYRKVVD